MTSNNEAYQTLRQSQKALKLTDDDTQSMNASVTALQPPSSQNLQDLQLYERMLEEALQRQFPLSDRDNQMLANLQQVLHLSNQEVRQVRDRLLLQLAPRLRPNPTANLTNRVNVAPHSPDGNGSPGAEIAPGAVAPSLDPALNPTVAPASAVQLPQTVISRPPAEGASNPQSINKELISQRKREMEGASNPSENPNLALAGASAIANPSGEQAPQQPVAQATVQTTPQTEVQAAAPVQAAIPARERSSVTRLNQPKTPWYSRPEAILGALFAITLGILGGAWLATRSMNQVTQSNPQAAQPFENAGDAKAKAANYQAAIEDYSNAINMDDRNPSAFLKRGTAHHRLQDLDKAISDFDRAIALNPNFAEAYNNRSHARFVRGRYDEALQDAEKAIALNPALAEAYLNRGNVRFIKKNINEATQDFNRVIELRPNAYTLARAYNNLGNIAAAQPNIDAAIKNYDQATQLDSKYADAFFNRALALEAKQDLQAAIRGYRDAVGLYQTQGNENMRQRAQSAVDRLQQGLSTPASPDPKQSAI
jgi:tetratricopeptide (TPR) repeat protein